MSVSFVGAEGKEVTILVTDTIGQRLRIGTSESNRYYQSNFDSDADGVADSIKATFMGPAAPFGSEYSIFIIGHDENTRVGVVYDRADYFKCVSFDSRENDVPTAYLGSAFRDEVDGNYLDWIAGNDGNDVLYGGRSDQTLVGDAGSDRLFGYGGDDRLEGGVGRDILTGGAGADVFVFTPDAIDSKDFVADFAQAEGDRIDLSSFAPDLEFVNAFTGTGAEVIARSAGGQSALIFDLNGDGASDARIVFMGEVVFTNADLILPVG